MCARARARARVVCVCVCERARACVCVRFDDYARFPAVRRSVTTRYTTLELRARAPVTCVYNTALVVFPAETKSLGVTAIRRYYNYNNIINNFISTIIPSNNFDSFNIR